MEFNKIIENCLPFCVFMIICCIGYLFSEKKFDVGIFAFTLIIVLFAVIVEIDAHYKIKNFCENYYAARSSATKLFIDGEISRNTLLNLQEQLKSRYELYCPVNSPFSK